MTTPRPVTVDVVSDAVCPWCYLGKRRLDVAIGMVPEVSVEVRWRPFQLDPSVPRAGMDRGDYLRRKFGSTSAFDATHAQLEAAGAAVGIGYRFESIARSPNTLDAHRLIRWAADAGCQNELVETLFRLYFVDGADIGDSAVLAAAAAGVGMDATTVAADLATDRDVWEVKQEIEMAGRVGISGVPCFILDSRYAVMGAQSPETLADAIRTAAGATRPGGGISATA